MYHILHAGCFTRNITVHPHYRPGFYCYLNLVHPFFNNQGIKWLSNSFMITEHRHWRSWNPIPDTLTSIHDQNYVFSHSLQYLVPLYHKSIPSTFKDQLNKAEKKYTLGENADTFTFVIPDLHHVSRREGYPPLVSEWVGNRNEQSIVHVHALSGCPSPVIIQHMAACTYFSVRMSLKAKHYIPTSTRRRFLASMPTLTGLNSPDTYLPV